MTHHTKYTLIKSFFIVYLSLFLMSCDVLKENNTHNNLLLITIENSKVIDHGEYNKQLKAISKNIELDNLNHILAKVLFMPNARDSVISIQNSDHNNSPHSFYEAVIIYDDVPEDDSVSGYRYDIKMHYTKDDVWQFIEMRESWRCWEGRGHREFSLLPCS